MSLNNIQLSPSILLQLYKYSLIDLPGNGQPEEKNAPKHFATLGNNYKQILLLVSSEDTLYLPDEELNFLMGILAACSLTMDDVAIMNSKKNKEITYKKITAELNPGKVFLFGVSPAQIELPLTFPDYQVQQYNNQVYLKAPLLSVFKDNKAEKTKLWNCLRTIFNI